MNSTYSFSNKVIMQEMGLRLILASLLSIFVWKIYFAFQAQPSIALLLLLIGETLTLGLVIFARLPTTEDRRPYAFLITMAATFYFLLLELSADRSIHLVPQIVAGAIQVMGIGLQVTAKVWLGRSFGLLPANRGIVTAGPYRIVRHPIYFGYFLNHVGTLLYFFSIWNLLLYGVLYALQILRIIEEEKLLRKNKQYEEYTTKVRYRFIPLVF